MTGFKALQQASKYDELHTPAYAVKPLLKYIPQSWTIWECTDPGNSKITEVLGNNGHAIVSTHINRNFDFLKDRPDFDFDIIVTNPPYSIRDKFLEKCYEYKKPFALLIPNDSTSGVGRVKLFAKHGVQFLFFNRRVDYTGKNRNWKPTAWFCWKVLPKPIIFHQWKKYEMKVPSPITLKLNSII